LAQDSQFCHGTFFAKFNNGRFFFNGEAAWLYWSDRLLGDYLFTLAPITEKYLPSKETEQWRYLVETGFFAGPSKLSFLAAWSPGPDRRRNPRVAGENALIGKQSAAFVWHPTFDSFLGNYDVFRPYSFIFTYNYGSGVGAYNLSLDGYLRDALVLGGRLDFAVAANLNAYGTFMWADRTSSGYGWACMSPNDTNMPVYFTSTPNDGNIQFKINGAPTSPNIPETALGWEANVGVDWQLLEGFSTGFLLGYWQPGKWFSYACIDRSVVDWNAPAVGNNWGTRPNKTIDPIVAGQVTMSLSF
jgi:hypothetical protein